MIASFEKAVGWGYRAEWLTRNIYWPGDTVDVVLAGVDSSALAVGALVCHPEWPVPVAARMEARIVVLNSPMPILKGRQVSMRAHLWTSTNMSCMQCDQELGNRSCWSIECNEGYFGGLHYDWEESCVKGKASMLKMFSGLCQVSIHMHTAQESGQISRLISVLNPKTGEVTKARPRAIVKGQTALVEISLARPVCVEQYTDYRALGRIALRDGGHTIAVGIVVLLLESC